MIKEIASEIDRYHDDWDAFENMDTVNHLIKSPSAVGWKTEDFNEFMQSLGQLLRDGAEQVHIGKVNERFIASIVFSKPFAWGIHIVKLMQRRPGSDDPIGLDHIDFLTKEELKETKLALANISDWEEESNDVHTWISLRFNGREAKLVDHLVIDVAVQELEEIEGQILDKKA